MARRRRGRTPLCSRVLSFDHIGPTSTAGYTLARRYLVALWPFTVAAAVSSLFVGALNATSDYVSAALSPAWRWLTVLACVLIFGNTAGVVALIAGHALGEAVRVWRLWTTVKSRYALDASSAGARSPSLFGVLRAASGQLLASGLVAVVWSSTGPLPPGLPNGSISLLHKNTPIASGKSPSVCDVKVFVVLLTKWSHDAVARGSASGSWPLRLERERSWPCALPSGRPSRSPGSDTGAHSFLRLAVFFSRAIFRFWPMRSGLCRGHPHLRGGSRLHTRISCDAAFGVDGRHRSV